MVEAEKKILGTICKRVTGLGSMRKLSPFPETLYLPFSWDLRDLKPFVANAFPIWANVSKPLFVTRIGCFYISYYYLLLQILTLTVIVFKFQL